MAIERGKGEVKREERRTRGRFLYIYQFRSAPPDFFKEGEKMDYFLLVPNDEQRVHCAFLSIEERVMKYYLIVCFPILTCSYQ